MTRRVFFSFHFERDAWRANVVRHSWLCQPSRQAAGYIDAAEFEKLKCQGDSAIRRWIDAQMDYTSVTVVLIGAETAARSWVRYEVELSLRRGNGLLGIRIHNIENQHSMTDIYGVNPLNQYRVPTAYGSVLASDKFKTYDWVTDGGRLNLGRWVEEAAQLGGRQPVNTNYSW